LIIKNKVVEKELHKEQKLMILMVIPITLLFFGLFLGGPPSDMMRGLIRILLSPTILITDFLEVGGIGAAFVNAALIAFFNLFLLWRFKMRINGLLIAAVFTVIGFSFFGKNIFNILPIYFGGYLYSRYQKIPMRSTILVVMFATALAPVVSELSFAKILPAPYNVIVGVSAGILVGFIISPLSSQMLKFHDGFNLYNIGFAAGIVGTVLTSVLRSLNVTVTNMNTLFLEHNPAITLMLALLFLYLMAVGLYINPDIPKIYRVILKYTGRSITDFTLLLGYGLTFFNMGLLGLASLAYITAIGGVINGPVLAGIFTVVGFGAFGKHPKNCFPVVLGVILAALVIGYDLSSTGIIITVLFSTTIAPIAGTYGLWVGLLAGALHMAIVTNVGSTHGGINLYNNGFAGGIVAGFLVPIVDAFRKGED
jgi:hypothetical protein